MGALHLHVVSCVLVVILGSLVLAYDNPRCVSSCLGKSDGKYQSCKNCHVYVTCTRGLLMDGWPCPRGTVWDENDKNCKTTSETCTEEEPQQTNDDCQCASSCSGLADGKYQSCKGCHVYALCRRGQLLDDQPCQRYSSWDDHYKRCLFRSSTCGSQCQDQVRPYRPGSPAPPTPSYATPPIRQPRTTTESSSEQGVQYQTAAKWPNWSRGTSRRPYIATTPASGAVCGCISDCAGKDDGRYPSCHGCEYFAICFQGQIYDSQECPAGRVWYDKVKKCVRGTDFCKSDCAPGATTPPEEEEEEESEESEDASDLSDEDGSDEQQQGGAQRPYRPQSKASSEESQESDSSSRSGGRPQWAGRGRGRGRGKGRGRGQGRGHGGYGRYGYGRY